MRPSPAEIRRVLRYDPETGLLWWNERGGARQMHRPAGSKDSEGYVQVCYKYKVYKAHRLAWVIMKGRWPKTSIEIDHRNGAVADNRWNNLRLATPTQNKQNRRHVKNKSGLKGAQFHSGTGRWTSTIWVNKKVVQLGIFDCPEQAHAAYVAAAKKYFGEFARAA